MTTYYETAAEYVMRKGLDPYEQIDLQAERIKKLEAENAKLRNLLTGHCEYPKDCIGPIVEWETASQSQCGYCMKVHAALYPGQNDE